MVDIVFKWNLAAKVRGYGENVNWNWKEKVQKLSRVPAVQKVPDF
ncbi:MAG: hypothetical protein ABI208_05545 [Ginsengibacter sp.]